MAAFAQRQMNLVYRMLSQLDDVERDETEPDALQALYAIDHAGTQLRRRAENLLLLAGGQVGDGMDGPETLLDVARSAQCESSSFTPVTITAMPPGALKPGLSDDMCHLLAEFLDNAIAFSPPDPTITLSGHANPDGGVLLRVVDTGVGISLVRLAELNARLAAVPVLDVPATEQMGLRVVATIAHRHGLFVQLAPNPGGGTIAMVNIPGHLVLVPPEAVPVPAPAALFHPSVTTDPWGRPAPTAVAAGLTTGGLPRRQRLRVALPAQVVAAPEARPPDPESVRDDLDALQAGEARARVEIARQYPTKRRVWE